MFLYRKIKLNDMIVCTQQFYQMLEMRSVAHIAQSCIEPQESIDDLGYPLKLLTSGSKEVNLCHCFLIMLIKLANA